MSSSLAVVSSIPGPVVVVKAIYSGSGYSPTVELLSMRSVRKPTPKRVSDTPSVAFPAPMTGTLDTDGTADHSLASSLQEGEEQAIERLQKVLAERVYRHSVKDEEKDVHGANLSLAL